MSRLEQIQYVPFVASLSEQAGLVWSKAAKRNIEGLPQLYWRDGRPWGEVNVWAVERAASQLDLKTVVRTMKHLNTYANFLESVEEGRGIDWRHFPIRKEEQVLRRFRKYLICECQKGYIASSTASNCMNAVIQFYRFSKLNNMVGEEQPMWADKLVAIPYVDSAGFERTMVRATTDLSITNRTFGTNLLEDGLLPLREEHTRQLLAFTSENEIEELHLMLATGFFTGARVGSITTLTVNCLQTAREDPHVPNVFLLRVGPGTDISTKFSVSGELLVPKAILDDLKSYAHSAHRLLREARAQQADKGRLFLTRSGQPYKVETVNRLVYEMRKRAVTSGLQFMQRFKFHQSRATFGTWLMQILLDAGAKTDAIRFVRDAMCHKDEATTLKYIRFLENTRGKARCAQKFNEAFTGLKNRDWNDVHA